MAGHGTRKRRAGWKQQQRQQQQRQQQNGELITGVMMARRIAMRPVDRNRLTGPSARLIDFR